MKRIRLTKIKQLPDARHHNNIPEGFVIEGYATRGLPVLDERFWLDDNWSTSGVLEILPNNTFKTYSSIYQYEIIG